MTKLKVAPYSHVVPGEIIGSGEKLGIGTYEREGTVFASVCGQAIMDAHGYICVERAHRIWIDINTILVGMVTRIGRQQVTLDIVSANNVVTALPIKATLRREDVFSQGVDPTTLDLTEIYRPGDLIQAVVINTDDNHRYGVSVAPDAGMKTEASAASTGFLRLNIQEATLDSFNDKSR